MKPKRRLAWQLYDEPGGHGAIVTDLDTEQWATGSGTTETAARALAIRRLPDPRERRGAGSGSLIDQCRAYALRSEAVPAHLVLAVIGELDRIGGPAR